MEKEEKQLNRFGLIGKNIAYSFSRGYFAEKFQQLGLHHYHYDNFDLQHIELLPKILADNKNLKGLNVTIPYKESVLPYLASLDEEAEQIGAVNTIKFTPEGLKGYNTDVHGFKASLLPFLKPQHKKALILGTGGASKAVAFVFKSLHIPYLFVSRNRGKHKISYADLDAKQLASHTIIVNCTPLGTSPNIEEKPAIPYEHIGTDHLLFDLIYNPEKTAFLKEGESQGARIANGHRMLQLQAEKAWEIWRS
ncbi:shikimate dehydrogenase family protein [Spongiimicrobium salis]|uniref:shikimate dehydrogenase family protein n=1 Tax=Spongiimicrobium salis TaxID=1667022 RepID=UPI00374D158E